MNLRKKVSYSTIMHQYYHNWINWRRILVVPFPTSRNASTLYTATPLILCYASAELTVLNQSFFDKLCILWITHLILKCEFILYFYILSLKKQHSNVWHQVIKNLKWTWQKKSNNFTRRRWNRTTEHFSSPTDLKSALHTNEDHPRIVCNIAK